MRRMGDESLVDARCGARWPKETESEALTDGGRRAVSSDPRLESPVEPEGLVGNFMFSRFDTIVRITGTGMRGNSVSK